MDAPALEIISRARTLLQDDHTTWRQQEGVNGFTDTQFDDDKFRWRASDLAIFVDEAQHEVCLRFPHANLVTAPVRVVAGQSRQAIDEDYYSKQSWSQGVLRVEANLVSNDGVWDPDNPGVTYTQQAPVYNTASYALTPATPWASMKNGAVLVVTVMQFTSGNPSCDPNIPGLTTWFQRGRTLSAGSIASGTRRVIFRMFKVDAVPSPATLSLNVTGSPAAYASRVFYFENVDFTATDNDNPVNTYKRWNEYLCAYGDLMLPTNPLPGSVPASLPLPLSRAAAPRVGDYSIAMCATKASDTSVVSCDSYPLDGLQPYLDDLWTITSSPSAPLNGFQLFGRATNPYIGEWEQPPALVQTEAGTLLGGHFIVRRAPLNLSVGSVIPMAQRDAIKSFYPEVVNDLYDEPSIPVDWYPAATETGSWFKAWSPDPDDPRGYFLFPNPSSLFGLSTRIQVTHMAAPIPIRNPDDKLTLPEQYWPLLVYWVAYRAMSIRSTTFNRIAARKYYKLFTEAIVKHMGATPAIDQRKGRANALPW